MRTEGPVTYVPLPHHVHDKIRGWIQSPAADKPTLPVTFSLDRQAYSSLGLSLPRLRHNSLASRLSLHTAVADTGAGVMVIPTSVLENMNIKVDSIFPIQTRLNME